MTKPEAGPSELLIHSSTVGQRKQKKRLPTGRLAAAIAWVGLLTVAFLPVLVSVARYTTSTDLHSHCLLIPFVSGYLLLLKRGQLPGNYETASRWAVGALLLGFSAMGWALLDGTGCLAPRQDLSPGDFCSLFAFSYVCFVWAGGFALLGKPWMKAAAFPMAFLIFFVPLPDGLVNLLERILMLASAETADFYFRLLGTPNLREGMVFQLPNINIEVAQQCSGIRSSWVLFITGILASHLFLRTQWRRIALVAFIIPLGILRNGFRILVIGILCVEIGPHMIHSMIHNQGGPVFFILSLIPLFLLLWWMRRRELRAGRKYLKWGVSETSTGRPI